MKDARNGPVKRIIPGVKDDSGAFVPETTDLDIDALLNEGRALIAGILRVVKTNVKCGTPSRNDVMNLKDCMAMLEQLKAQEGDLLDDLTVEELQELLNERRKS